MLSLRSVRVGTLFAKGGITSSDSDLTLKSPLVGPVSELEERLTQFKD